MSAAKERPQIAPATEAVNAGRQREISTGATGFPPPCPEPLYAESGLSPMLPRGSRFGRTARRFRRFSSSRPATFSPFGAQEMIFFPRRGLNPQLVHRRAGNCGQGSGGCVNRPPFRAAWPHPRAHPSRPASNRAATSRALRACARHGGNAIRIAAASPQPFLRVRLHPPAQIGHRKPPVADLLLDALPPGGLHRLGQFVQL